MFWLIALALIGIGIWNFALGMQVWGVALWALAFLTICVSIDKAIND